MRPRTTTRLTALLLAAAILAFALWPTGRVALADGNTPPIITLPSGSSINQGDDFSDAGSFIDPDADLFVSTVDWDDGFDPEPLDVATSTPTSTFPLFHVFQNPGIRTVTVSIYDGTATSSASFFVNVNALPTVSIASSTSTALTLELAGTVADTDSPPPAVTVDWDDGTPPEIVTLDGSGGFAIDHAYSVEQARTIVVTAVDDDGATGQAVFVHNNIPPAIDPLADISITEGTLHTVSGSFTDPDTGQSFASVLVGGDLVSAGSINWGDGSDPEDLTISPGPSATEYNFESPPHLFPDDAVYTITVEITDQFDTVSDSLILTIVNVAPALVMPAPITIDEGALAATSAGFVDPGADAWTGTVDWDDASPLETLNIDPDSKSFPLSHTYASNGAFTVTLTVEDDDGGTGAGSFTITVDNVAPTIGPLTNTAGIEGSPFTTLGTFTDPGDNPFTGTVSFGDGSSPETFTIGPGNTFSLSHTYINDGSFVVQVSVGDGVDTTVVTTTVTIANAVPVIALSPISLADINLNVTFSGSVSDPGANDALTISIDFGDGSAAGTPAIDASGDFNTTHQYPLAGAYIVAITVSDDGGGSSVAGGVIGVFAPPDLGDLNLPAPASETTTGGSTVFATNEDIWGPVTGGTGNVSWPLFFESFSKSGSASAIAYNVGPTSWDFGAEVSGRLFGHVGLKAEVDNLSGSVDITYPVGVDIEHPEADSFLAGSAVSIGGPTGGGWFLNPGAELDPGETTGDLLLKGQFRLGASAGGTLCFFDCATFSVFPSFDTGDQEITLYDSAVPGSIPPLVRTLMSAASGFLTGISGDFDSIRVEPPVSHVVGRTLVTNERNRFSNLNFDLDSITRILFGTPFLGATLGTQDSVGISAEIFDADAKINLFADQTLKFDSDVLVRLDFSRPVAGVTGDILALDPGLNWVVYPADGSVSVIFPQGETDPITVVPTITVNGRITNDTFILTESGLQFRALGAFLAVPSVEIVSGIPGSWWQHGTFPFTAHWECHGVFCTSGHYHSHKHWRPAVGAINSPAINVGFGPVWDTGLIARTANSDALANDTFSIGTLGSFTLNPFTLNPEVPPVAVLPNIHNVNEGSTVLLDAGRSFDADHDDSDDDIDDDLLYRWDIGDDGIFETAFSSDPTFLFSQTVDGPVSVKVTVEVSDGLNSDKTTTFVVIANVAPVVVAGTNTAPGEGAVFTLATTFTDPGAIDTHTATIDWGDGTSETGVIVEPTFGPAGTLPRPLITPGQVLGSHVYADDGLYTVTITVTDDDSGVGTDTLTITINNVNPTMDTPDDTEIIAFDELIIGPFPFNDLGTLDMHTVEIDWGDGTPVSTSTITESPFGPPGSTSGADGSIDPVSHTYTTDGRMTITITLTDDDGGEAVVDYVVDVIGSLTLKTRALDALLLAPGSSKRINKAIRELGKALDPKLWDAELFVDPKHGKQVFDHQRHAVKELEKLPKEKGSTAAQETAAQEAIALMLKADQVLNSAMFHEVNGLTSVDPKRLKRVEKELERATEDFNRAESEAAAGNPDKAIEHYRKAWQHLQGALRHAGVNEGG